MHLDFPTVPYCGPLNQQLQCGAVIQAKGQTFPGSNYFAIALQCGSSTNFSDDIALYLSASFQPPPRIIRNSLIQNQWGPEESYGGFPLGSPGQSFEIIIMIEPEQYRIAFNGQHFTEYRHRLPFERCTHVSLMGDFRLETFSIWYSQNFNSGGGLYPTLPQMDMGGMPTQPPMNPAYSEYQQPPPPPYGQVPYPPYPPQPYGQPPPPGPYPGPGGQYDPNPYQNTSGSGSNNPGTGSSSGGTGGGGGGGGIGNMLGGALTGVATGLATNAITSKIFGRKHHHYGPSSMLPGLISGVAGSTISNAFGGGHHQKPHKHKKSSSAAIPIAGLAAGAGAAALAAGLLSNPIKKAFKHKSSSWSHKDWGGRRGSSSSSSSEEE